MAKHHINKLRVWWIPQIPMKPFHVAVDNLIEAKLVINTLAHYDLFQLANRIKPDYANGGGLEIDRGDGWEDWTPENIRPEGDANGIEDFTLQELREGRFATSEL